MARESQRYQVGLIICIMLIVVLLGAFFFFWRSNNEYAQLLEAEKKRVLEADRAVDNLSSQIQYLKAMIGVGETTMQALEQSGLTINDESLQAIKTQFDQDMKQFGQGLPEDQQTYIQIVKNLTTSLNKINEQLAEANAQVKAANDERDRKVDELTRQVAAADEGRRTAEQSLATATEQFNAARAEYTASQEASKNQIDEIAKELADLQQSSAARIEELLTTQGNLVNQIQKLNQDIEELQQGFASFESADGKVTNVSQIQRRVWLNLGQEDGLRSQVTFSVYDGQSSSSEIGRPKARIEVTRVTGPHQSEARILEDSLTNPIMRGDLVYSPAFRAGRDVHFALAGVIDLNDDNVSDRELVRNLIAMNGGQIDAEQLEDGTVSGTISATTRYLVLGSEPASIDVRQNPELMTGYSNLREAATNFGVKTLKVEEFLDMMGWKPEVESVHLGPSSSPEADRAGSFRPRRPPTPMPRGEDDSAFE